MKRVMENNPNTLTTWDEIYGGPHREEWTIWHDPKLVALFASVLPSNSHVIDLACGNAWTERHISERRTDIRWSAGDFSPQSIEFLKTVNIPWQGLHLVDLNRPLPFADRQFDAVICSEALEHLDDPEACARELMRIASKVVAVTTPNQNSYPTIYHVWSFEADDLKRMFSKARHAEVTTVREGKILVCFAHLD